MIAHGGAVYGGLRGTLAADLAARAFTAPADPSCGPPRLGAEVEFIPVDATTRARRWVVPFLRWYGAPRRWQEQRTPKGSPCFTLPEGGTVTFEPGGQLEYSTPPLRSASALLAQLHRVIPPLRAAASAEGIELLAIGIDPFNPIERAPLFLHGSRYERMAEYFALRHPAGARMMRQTAAFQLNLDLGDASWLRWRVLNAAAPYLVATFANSPVYAGAPAGCASARAQVWRALDPARTGLPYDERGPVRGYLEFALAAPAMLLPTIDGEHRPFGEWLGRANLTRHEWDDHLSTLFPEVRPRGRFELRSCDAIPPEVYAAAVALAAGLVYDPAALRAAADLLGTPDRELLDRAGRLGLRDRAIARTAADLADIALRGCRALGPRYFHPADVERARAFFGRYTYRGRSPADDVLTTQAGTSMAL